MCLIALARAERRHWCTVAMEIRPIMVTNIRMPERRVLACSGGHPSVARNYIIDIYCSLAVTSLIAAIMRKDVPMGTMGSKRSVTEALRERRGPC